jgi:hypothetical protein
LIPAAEELGYYGLAERTKRMASRVPDLDIFSQGLVERLNGGWRVTEKGRSVLKFIEARPDGPEPQRAEDVRPALPKAAPPERLPGEARARRAGAAVNAGSAARERTRANAS